MHDESSAGQERGLTLIMAVIAMMILGILGWTLANLFSLDQDANVRNLDAERAFYLAESGIQEAMMHLALNDTVFDADTKTLDRSLALGVYNVSRATSGTTINVTSSGYVPNRANYRAMRRIKIAAAIPSVLGVSAFTGGYLFDWDQTRGYSINVNGAVVSEHYEGIDTNIVFDQTAAPSDFNVPFSSGSPQRLWGPTTLPPLDMGFFSNLANTSGTYYASSTTFSGKNNNMGLVFVNGNVTINTDSGGKGTDFSHSNIIATGNITIIGTGTLSIKSHVNPNGRCYPVLATQYGNITSSAPSGYAAGSRYLEGLIYTQYGTADFNCINGNSIMARVIKLRGNVALAYDSKYLDMSHGFTSVGSGLPTILSWKEE